MTPVVECAGLRFDVDLSAEQVAALVFSRRGTKSVQKCINVTAEQTTLSFQFGALISTVIDTSVCTSLDAVITDL